jgi:hypothetical protein
MRVISLYQPWAELIRRGLKRWETRGHVIEYRGVIAIHAAKKKFRSEDYWPELRRQLLMDGVDPFGLVYGAVLCFVDIVDRRRTEEIRDVLDARERIYGNYDDHRHAYELLHLVPLAKPIPLVGHQGIFHWPEGKAIYEMAPQ